MAEVVSPALQSPNRMAATFGMRTGSERRRGSILVIEDRDDVRQGLAQLLELHGYLVADARTGEQAIEQLTTDPEGVALVLLDLVLPGPVSGVEVRAKQLANPGAGGHTHHLADRV